MRDRLALTLIRGALVLGLVAGVGCKRLKTGAREEFGRKYTCPEERIEVRARDDVTYGDLVLRSQTRETPPDEVKNDPGRRAKWEHDQKKKRDDFKDSLDGLDVFEVRGCGHTVLLGCGHPGDSEGVSLSEVSCSEAPPQPKSPAPSRP